jgi:hypothetical protein
MLSSYPVACPHESCGWTGNLVPTPARGGEDAESASHQPAWFCCPQCGRDWEARVTDDAVTVLSGAEHGG